MAAYRRVYDSRHLQADCQELESAPEPYAGYKSSMGYVNEHGLTIVRVYKLYLLTYLLAFAWRVGVRVRRLGTRGVTAERWSRRRARTRTS